MFASLLMSVAIPDAFDGRAWLFVTGYLLLEVGRSAFLIVALRGRPLGEHFVNQLVWELLAGIFWVAGAGADGDARGLKQILSGDSDSARTVRAGLGRRGINLAHARAITLFGSESRPGAAAEFTVSRDGMLIVAAPGLAMEAGAQDT